MPVDTALRTVTLRPKAPPAVVLRSGMRVKQLLTIGERQVTLFEDKIKVHDLNPDCEALPRRYTLTRDARTAELFLTIGAEYNQEMLDRPQTRQRHGETMAELTDGQGPRLLLTCLAGGDGPGGRAAAPGPRRRNFEKRCHLFWRPFVMGTGSSSSGIRSWIRRGSAWSSAPAIRAGVGSRSAAGSPTTASRASPARAAAWPSAQALSRLSPWARWCWERCGTAGNDLELLAPAEHLDSHPGGAEHADAAGQGFGEVDDSTARVGAAVVDAADRGAASVEVGDPDHGLHRQAAAGEGEGIAAEPLAGGGAAPVEAGTIPGRPPDKHRAWGGRSWAAPRPNAPRMAPDARGGVPSVTPGRDGG